MQDNDSEHDPAPADSAAGPRHGAASQPPRRHGRRSPGALRGRSRAAGGHNGEPAKDAPRLGAARWPRPGRLALGIGAAGTAVVVAFAAFAAAAACPARRRRPR